MTLRTPPLPFLPGYSINPNYGRTKFGKNVIFEKIAGVPMMTDKLLAMGNNVNLTFPSIFSRCEVAELPGWIAYDKQVLTFDAYFQETLIETYGSSFQIRSCKIYFFLEDGTIKVIEPKVHNSGMPQGTLICRQRIPFPPPKDDQFFEMIDFNIGREVELYGKVFKITNCDKFTRIFLNRLGIAVPDPINTPNDPYLLSKKDEKFPKKPNPFIDKFGQFLQYDRVVLRFYGYWDDRETEGGYIHNLTILYYLADDTIEITEKSTDSGSTFVKRGKLPKFFNELPSPGFYDTNTVLNVLGPSINESRFVLDSLNAGKNNVRFYKQEDLSIGAAIIVYGRKVVLTDCDPFTKQFYSKKFGLDDFTPVKTPKEKPQIVSVPLYQRKLPPWNGYGSFEDSAQNCRTVNLKPPCRDFKKFIELDKSGFDSRILRFKAAMRSKIPENCSRKFIVQYYLCDNTIMIQEVFDKAGKVFLKRGERQIPGQEEFTSEPPDLYQPYHLYVGAQLVLNHFVFVLTDADEYCLRYMELHPNEFAKANIQLIMDKVRDKLKPIYKDFVAEHLPTEQPVIPFETLRDKLCHIMGEDWTEHEMITLARHFSAICRTERHSRAFIRQIVLTELKKMLWDDLIRLREYWKAWDSQNKGFLPRKDVYTLLKGNKIPLDKEVIENMLNVLSKNDQCEIEGEDLFKFLDRSFCPLPDILPMNFKKELWFASEKDPVAGRLIDWCAFNKALNLEQTFKEPIVVKKQEGEV